MKALFLAAALALAAPASGSAQTAAAVPPAAPTERDWRTPDPQNVLVIDTEKGRILVEMSPIAAPAHVARIRALTRQKFYDGRAFFRVIDGFMDQTGDPTDTGQGGSTLPDLAGEFMFRRGDDTPIVVVTSRAGIEHGFLGVLPVISQTVDLGLLTADNKVNAWGDFCPGVAGMARAQAEDSANSQFFLMRATNQTLNQKYTAWGRALSGLDVIRAIKTGEPVAPPQDRMRQVRILADIPVAERPKVRMIDTAGPWFKARIAQFAAAGDPTASICDIDIPVQLNGKP